AVPGDDLLGHGVRDVRQPGDQVHHPGDVRPVRGGAAGVRRFAVGAVQRRRVDHPTGFAVPDTDRDGLSRVVYRPRVDLDRPVRDRLVLRTVPGAVDYL